MVLDDVSRRMDAAASSNTIFQTQEENAGILKLILYMFLHSYIYAHYMHLNQ